MKLSILILLFTILFSQNLFSNTDFSMTTWNIGLAHSYVYYAKQRTPHIVDALKKIDSDIVCIQEMWNKEDIDLVTNTLKEKYPHSFMMPFKQKMASRIPACGTFGLIKLFGYKSVGGCLLWKCFKKEGDELTDCILNTCGPAIKRLKRKDRECAEALFAQVGMGGLKAILRVSTKFKERIGLFTYKGSNGLAIYSKYPIDTVEGLNMDKASTLSRRSVLYAKVKVGGKNRHVACTHLSANLMNVPYTGKFESWEDESLHQAKMMTAFVEKKANNEPTYLAGDFNCSFEDLSRGVAGQFPNTCNHFKNSGYFNKMLENAECTFCQSNTLVTDEWEKSKLIDHIFVKNVDTTKLHSEVIMKDLVTIKTNEGDEVQSNLSDHYGVRLETSK